MLIAAYHTPFGKRPQQMVSTVAGFEFDRAATDVTGPGNNGRSYSADQNRWGPTSTNEHIVFAYPQGIYLQRTLLRVGSFDGEVAWHGNKVPENAQKSPALTLPDVLMPVMDGSTLLHPPDVEKHLFGNPYIGHAGILFHGGGQ